MLSTRNLNLQHAGKALQLAVGRIRYHAHGQIWNAAVHNPGMVHRERTLLSMEGAGQSFNRDVDRRAIDTGADAQHLHHAVGDKITHKLFDELNPANRHFGEGFGRGVSGCGNGEGSFRDGHGGGYRGVRLIAFAHFAILPPWSVYPVKTMRVHPFTSKGAQPDTRSALLSFALMACQTAGVDTGECPPEKLFGTPNENTGLTAEQCAPECASCGADGWGPPAYDAADFAAWRSWKLLDGPTVSAADPYLSAWPAPTDDQVCAAAFSDSDTYQLADFASADAALAAGTQITHFGNCGTCSSLSDLAVYAEYPDLTEPVRACGLAHLDGDQVALAACIAELGFTAPCADTWAWNTLHTRDECAAECFAALDAPYHNTDGSLNDCLQCDEIYSGDVFKAVAGRTRRNTGLASSMCRPCSEVRPLEHGYGGPE